MSPAILDVTLEGFELHNRNTGRGGSYHISANQRRKFERDLRSAGHSREPFAFPVVVTLVRILKARQRLYDFDSGLRGAAKELIDSLVAVGWFHDDKPEWLHGVGYMQDPTQKAFRTVPATRVVVWKADAGPASCPVRPAKSLIA